MKKPDIKVEDIKLYYLKPQTEGLSQTDVEQTVNSQLLNQTSGQQKLASGIFQSANFVTGSTGWQFTPTGAEINGGLAVDSIDIGGADTSSFHVDTDGNMWLGAATFATPAPWRVANTGDMDVGGTDASSWHVDKDGNMWWGSAGSYAAATVKISNAGAGAFSSMTITGGAITGTPIASIPNSTATDISLLNFTHDLVFSVTDADTVAWASGTITMSNGRTFSIGSGNTGNMAARTYIYLDTGVSSVALQTTTTVSTAMGANKLLIAVAQNGSGQPTYQVYGGIGGLKIGSAGINISNNNWTYSGTWSVTDADTIAWASGTLKVSDGTSYSITGSNTGNMAAKTYIYFDLGTSSTAFQTTTTATTAIGDGKILIAIAQNGTGEANYMVMNDKQHNIDAANIVAGSITANELAAGSVTAAKISVTTLSAITADMGSLTAGTIGLDSGTSYIKSGQTAYDTGTGFWLERNGGTPRFSIGNSAGNKVTWNGTTLSVVGSITASTIDGTTTVNGSTAENVQQRAEKDWDQVVRKPEVDDMATAALAGAGSVDRGVVTTLIRTNGGGTARYYTNDFSGGTVHLDWDDPYEIIIRAKIVQGATSAATDNRAFFGLWDGSSGAAVAGAGADPAPTTRHIAFYLKEDGTFVASTADGTTNSTTTISSVTLTNWNTYRIVWTPATNALFYVNDVLKVTKTTNIPSGATNPPNINFEVFNSSGTSTDFYLANNYMLLSTIAS